MKSKLVIGLDFGTDSVRAILVDTANGEILAEAGHPYRRWSEQLFCNGAESQFRQHPQDYLDGLSAAVKDILYGIDPERVAGIGVDTTGSTVCAVDRSGTPLAMKKDFSTCPDAMFLLWKDHSAITEAGEINRAAANWKKEDFRRFEGGEYSCEWFWSKILHVLRSNQKVANAAFSWVEHCDWITAELTGNTDPLSMKRGRCAAGHKAMWHPAWDGLPPEDFLNSIDPALGTLRARLYSATQTADIPIGHLSRAWAEHLGLTTNTSVAGGQLDCHAGAVGAGIRSGTLVKVVGTSTCDILVAEPGGKCVHGICGQVDGSVLPGLTGFEAGQSAFGDIYRWFQNFLSAFGSEISIAQIEKNAAALPPDPSGNLLALDWFNGRRSPDANPHLKGAILGLTLASTPEAVYRALVMATCCGARRIVERFNKCGFNIDSISAVGGIARKAPFVMQTMADILNKPISILASPQACALGSAMNAAAAAGIYPSVQEAAAHMTPGCDIIYNPRTTEAGAGERLYQKYLRASESLEKLYTE